MNPRSLALRHLQRLAATYPLPEKFPREEIGLMTLDEFLEFRNPGGKFHSSESYTPTLFSLNRDYGWSHRITHGDLRIGIGRYKISIYQRNNDFKILDGDDELVAIVHKGTLYYPRSSTLIAKNLPRYYRDRDNNTVSLGINRTKEVKYLSEVLPLISSVSRRNLKSYPHLQQRIKVRDEYYEVRTDDPLKLDGGMTIAFLNSEGELVAMASDEWGATLLRVAKEYQGRGLGKILGKYWYKWNPSFPSGGFTQKGQDNAVAIWKARVREFLSKGWYSELIRSRRISKSKLNSILSELGQRGRGMSRLPSDLGPKDKAPQKRLLLHVDYPTFILYDQALLEVEDPYSVDLEPYIYGYGFFRDSGRGSKSKSFLYTIDYDRPYRELVTKVALQMARDEGELIYIGKDYGDLLELEGIPNLQFDGDYVSLTKDALPLDRLGQQEAKIRRKYDPYDERKNLLYETAEAKW